MSDEMRAEARALVASIDGGMVAQQTIELWISSLGLMVATGKMTEADAEMRTKTFASLLLDQYPAACFTQDSLRRAAGRFTWFPAYAELDAFLKSEKQRVQDQRFRLRAIAGDVQVALPPPNRSRDMPAQIRFAPGLHTAGEDRTYRAAIAAGDDHETAFAKATRWRPKQ